MRYTLTLVIVVLLVAVAVSTVFPQGIGSDEIGPDMSFQASFDLDVFIETVNESSLAGEIEDYLDDGFDCRFLSTALETEYGNNDRLYYGCAAFEKAGDWDALKWDYNYDASESQGTPSIPDDSIAYRTLYTPDEPTGSDLILSDRLSWDYLVHVCNNCPTELRNELSSKDLKKVWVENYTSQVKSFWKYEGGGQSKTIIVWSSVSGQQFGPLNVE